MSTNGNGRWEFDEKGNVHYVQSEKTVDGAYRFSNNTKKTVRKDDDGWHWILIVLGFVFWWPIGLVLLFLQISGKWKDNAKTRQTADAVKKAADQFRAGQNKDSGSVKQVVINTTADASLRTSAKVGASASAPKDKPARKKQDAQDAKAFGLGSIKGLRAIGGIMTGLFGFTFLMELIDEIRYFYDWGLFFENVTPLFALLLAGIVLLCVAGGRQRKLHRFRKYLTMIGEKDTVSIATLAKAMGRSEGKVEKDLEEMLERGIWEKGYVDAARRMLVLGEILEEPQEAPAEPETTDNATLTLRRIRSINDAIANEELSRKIDHIEQLTAKIFGLLEERPEKAGELRSFMNYYLPQTLKILDNYSKLEAQGIEGENIAEAKQKIESMMDKLVDGYETQLDKLFAGDVLDISADLKVMESMLEKDGLTVDSDLKL